MLQVGASKTTEDLTLASAASKAPTSYTNSGSNVDAIDVSHYYRNMSTLASYFMRHTYGQALRRSRDKVRRASDTLTACQQYPGISWRYARTLGPSLIRMDGTSSLGTGVVFHQLGAPSKDIFSSVESFCTRSGMDASRNERVMIEQSQSGCYDSICPNQMTPFRRDTSALL